MIRCVIVEDQEAHSLILIKLLKKIDTSINILSICKSVDEAIKAINQFNPELVFLDIKLDNDYTGFDLLNEFNELPFQVIFTSAYPYSDNTISAFRVDALHFLTKPLSERDLKESIARFNDLTKTKHGIIFIKFGNNDVKVELKNIVYCKSQDPVTHFFLKTNEEKSLQIRKSTERIKYWEDLFKHRYAGIYRIHNQFLINIDNYLEFDKVRNEVTLIGGIKLPVSRNREKGLLKLLEELKF